MIVFTAISLFSTLLLTLRYISVSSASQRYTTIPQFDHKGIQFYELSMLLDGDISVDDVMSMMIYYSGHAPTDDPIEKEMRKNISYHSLSVLYRIHYLDVVTEEEQNADVFGILSSKIKQPIIQKLKEKKMFRFNPQLIRNLSIFLMIMSVIPLLVSFPLAMFTNALIIISLGLMLIAATFINSAPLFYENLNNILEIKARARGYQMYLKTVEWYTVEKDMDKFFEHVPYFLLFGQKKEHLEKIVEASLSKFQLEKS
jgi:hypothetical protein